MCGEHLSTKNRASVSGDHPRMCGEHNPVVNTATGSAGSSPHVRGALFLCLVTTWPRGIIPACAGSTSTRSPHAPATWDHPRMCGEHAVIVDFVGGLPGSSPHVRGAPAFYACVYVPYWIIPACAGSTPA